MSDNKRFYIKELNSDGTACIYGPFDSADAAQARIDDMVRGYWADRADLSIIIKPKTAPNPLELIQSEQFIEY